MGVSLSSDLVADVLRNADPARLQTATARLKSLNGAVDGPAFAGVLHGVEASPEKVEQAHAGFERMVLRNLFEQILPGEDSGAFGTGPSAPVWRSMAADQFAGLAAEDGGLGIARSLAPEGDGRANLDAWPYFRTGKIEAFTGRG